MPENLFNCMTLIAGKGVTRDHRVLVGHNEDDAGLNFARHTVVPPRDWPEGSLMPAETGCARIPQVSHTLGYYWVEFKSDAGGLHTSDVFANDHGVVIVSDSMCESNEDKNDASIVRDGGIGHSLRRALAERSHSAREGAQILTDLIREWGYAYSGRAYIIADKDEAFMFQLVRGRHYMGARIPDDALAVMPNHYTLHTLNDCPEMFYPDDIIDYAVSKGWYAPSDGAFDFAKAYQREDFIGHPVNTLRQKHDTRLLLGHECEGYPFVVYPDHPVDVSAFADALSTHYEGTDDDRTFSGPGRSPHYDPQSRRVCTGSTLEMEIFQFDDRPELLTVFTAFGRPCQLPMIPLHPLCRLPECVREALDACAMADTHHLPEPGVAAHKHNALSRFRDFCSRNELVYADERAALTALLAEMRAEALTENESALERLRSGSDADDGTAFIENALKRLDAFVQNRPSPVRIRSLPPLPLNAMPDTLTLTLESKAALTETDMVFGVDMTDTLTEYAHILPNTLARTGEGVYEALFSAETVRKLLVNPGLYRFWLGGKTAAGSAFVSEIDIELQ